MNVIGIICEYNPLHNGHIYQINKIKEKYPDSILIALMSSSFTQRGDLSIVNKFNKARSALVNNIDLVVELPYIYSVQSADIFASYCLKILNSLKIDTLCFGTESDNIDKLINNVNITNNKEYDNLVNNYIKEGNNYPTALNKALLSLGGDKTDTPNDLLAFSYIKEIINNKYNINIFNIKRTNDYHDNLLDNYIVSSSNIRNRLLNNECIDKYIPLNTIKYIKNINNKYFDTLKYKIISEDDLSIYNDCNKELSIRIKKYINKANTLDDLIKLVKSKNYTYNKISRVLNHILCSFKDSEFNKDLEYIRILGFNNKGKDYLNKIKKDINILNTSNNNYNTYKVEKRVSEVYSLIYDDILEEEKSLKPIILK